MWKWWMQISPLVQAVYRLDLKFCDSFGLSIRDFKTKESSKHTYINTHSISHALSLFVSPSLLEHACIIHLATSRMWGLVKNWIHHSGEQRKAGSSGGGWEGGGGGGEGKKQVTEGEREKERWRDVLSGESVSGGLDTVNNWHYSNTWHWMNLICLLLERIHPLP